MFASLIENLELWQKVLSFIGVGATVLFTFVKIRTSFKTFESKDKKIDVEDNLIEVLHKEFTRINSELELARQRQEELRNSVHDQNLKLNQMEFLLLRAYNLLVHSGIEIPLEMKTSVENMLNGVDNGG